ncbi:major tail protein [Acetobacterium wieringae]|uniref:major tail protein n=1 Tax=Acetobacterium wieringae TaxID=52694 RepID=UPI0031596189
MQEMNLQLFATNSPVTGVKKLVYAIMTDEENETYGPVKSAPPLMNIKVAPKSDSAKLYADNDVSEIETSLGDIAVDFETKDMPLEIQADFFGHELDTETGQMVYNSNDYAPYLAIGYMRTKANKKNRYVWLHKVKFEEISEESKTKEDKPAFQTPKTTGTAIANKDGVWKTVADQDSGTSPATDAFLASVPGTTPADTVAPTCTSVPADGATGVIGTANIVLTFDKAIQTSTATSANIFIMKADGTAVPSIVTINEAKTVVTLDPVSTLTAGDYMLIATTGVKNTAGTNMAANYVANFTV